MYVVPDAYMTAIRQPVQYSKMKGTIQPHDMYLPPVDFTDNNILKESFVMTNQCSDGNYVQIGTVYVGELTCTFIGIDEIERNNWIGAKIYPVYQQKLGDGTYFDIKLGVFTVDTAEWSENGVTVVAYDNMRMFDKEYPINNDTGGRATGDPWFWLNGLCYACEMQLANTEEEIAAFNNGTEQLTLFTTDNVFTYRDLLHWITQAMGCFATIDRDGRLIIKKYGTDPIDTIDSKRRFKGGWFADFETQYSKVEVFDLQTGYWNDINHGSFGLTYTLYDNPFLQTDDSETRSRLLLAILGALESINYVPFKVSLIGNPMYWLGDVIRFTEGIAGTESLCCITKFTFHYHKEYIMEGAGQNPKFCNVKADGNGMQRGYDSTPKEGSSRPITSGGVYEALQNAGSGGGGNGVGQTTDEGGEIFNHYPGDNTNIFHNKATAKYAHAEGTQTTASGVGSHAEGYGTKAINLADHAEGNRTEASGGSSHAEGYATKATAYYAHAEGFGTIADEPEMTAMGAYNKAHNNNNTYSNLLVVGNGMDESSRSNVFRVDYVGNVYGTRSYKSSGADYAEYFEWLDGNPNNEDRVGFFVTLQDKLITKAKTGDYILGIVSGNPCIIGNADEDWLGRWQHDEFNRFINEEVDVPVLDEEGNETGEVIHICKNKENPNYDNTHEYIERKDRPEWDAVGMIGVLSVRDDGTCEVNGYAAVSGDGTATRAEAYISGQTYRVVKRITDNVVEVIFK